MNRPDISTGHVPNIAGTDPTGLTHQSERVTKAASSDRGSAAPSR